MAALRTMCQSFLYLLMYCNLQPCISLSLFRVSLLHKLSEYGFESYPYPSIIDVYVEHLELGYSYPCLQGISIQVSVCLRL